VVVRKTYLQFQSAAPPELIAPSSRECGYTFSVTTGKHFFQENATYVIIRDKKVAPVRYAIRQERQCLADFFILHTTLIE